MTRACLNGQRSAKTEVLDSDGDSFQRSVYRDSPSSDLQPAERISLFCMNLETSSSDSLFSLSFKANSWEEKVANYDWTNSFLKNEQTLDSHFLILILFPPNFTVNTNTFHVLKLGQTKVYLKYANGEDNHPHLISAVLKRWQQHVQKSINKKKDKNLQ